MISPQLAEQVIQWRRHLHTIPELGNDLPQTANYVRSVLDEHDIPYELYVQGNGIVATINGRSPGGVVALRGDMDGLPMAEQTGLEYASTNGRMHACGHDGHTAMNLGAAIFLQQHNDFPGTVKILFQPGEESPGGAKPMIEEGALDGVEAIFGLHLGNFLPRVPKGYFETKSGPLLAAGDTFSIRIQGRGGHGGFPQDTIDPIIIGTELVSAYQTIVSREVAPQEPVVISVTKFLAGNTHNIIPNEAVLGGTVRTVTPQTRELVERRMREITQSNAQAHGTEIELEYRRGYPALMNHPKETELAFDTATKLVGQERVQRADSPQMASEDFSYYLEVVPGSFMQLSNPGMIDGTYYPQHHPKFDLDESYLELGTNYLIQVALNFLETKKTE